MASKVFLNQLSQEVIDFIQNGAGGGSGGGSLSETIISNVTVGGANSGTVFPALTSFTDFAKKILLKDITPNVTTNFSNAGVHEEGTEVKGCTITVNIQNLSSVTVPINEIRFYDGSLLLTTQPFQAGQSTYTYNYTGIIKTNKTLSAEVIYNDTQKAVGTGNFTFVYASYYGTTDLASIGDAQATQFALTFNKSIKTTKALNWNNINLSDQRFCYLYPASFGELTSIKDGNGFEQLTGYTKTQVTITTPIGGQNIKYYCYLLTDAATGNNFTQNYS